MSRDRIPHRVGVILGNRTHIPIPPGTTGFLIEWDGETHGAQSAPSYCGTTWGIVQDPAEATQSMCVTCCQAAPASVVHEVAGDTVTTLTLVWNRDVSVDEVLRLSRAWTETISSKPVLERVDMRVRGRRTR